MGWKRGRGRSWSGPRAFRTALARGRGSSWAGGLEPEAVDYSSDVSVPILRNTAIKMKTRPLWSTALPTSPTR